MLLINSKTGDVTFSKERLDRILQAYGVSEPEFERIRRQPKLTLAKTCENGGADRTVDRKPRRNHLKIITKEVRVLRVLCKRRGLSQYAASKLCGFAPSIFGHIEEGRIELRPDRISHILTCLDRTSDEYQQLIHSPISPAHVMYWELIGNHLRVSRGAKTFPIETVRTVLFTTPSKKLVQVFGTEVHKGTNI